MSLTNNVRMQFMHWHLLFIVTIRLDFRTNDRKDANIDFSLLVR